MRLPRPLDIPLTIPLRGPGSSTVVELIGTRTLSTVWTKPSLVILGIDARRPNAAPNDVVASARASLSAGSRRRRPQEGVAAVQGDIERTTPWGARYTVSLSTTAIDLLVIDATGPYFDAAPRRVQHRVGRDTEPVDVGSAG